jgi:hypothetical protein
MEKVLMAQYAIKVPLLGIDQDWLYVTSQTPGSNTWAPMVYDTYEKAEEAAMMWGRAKVVEYEPRA